MALKYGACTEGLFRSLVQKKLPYWERVEGFLSKSDTRRRMTLVNELGSDPRDPANALAYSQLSGVKPPSNCTS
jgi:hypothetical protein